MSHLRVFQKPTINELFYFLLEYLKENHGAKTYEEIIQYMYDATESYEDVNEAAFIDVFTYKLHAKPESKRAVLAFAYVHDFILESSYQSEYFAMLHIFLEPEYPVYVWFKLSDRKKVRGGGIAINTEMKTFDRFLKDPAKFKALGSMKEGMWMKEV